MEITYFVDISTTFIIIIQFSKYETYFNYIIWLLLCNSYYSK